MPAQQFQAMLQSDDGSAPYLEVPSDAVAALGAGKRPAVRVTLNGYPYRTTVAIYGGRYFLPVRRQIRQAAGIESNDSIAVTMELDEEPREVEIPDDLAQALAADPEAQAAYDRLSYTHRREYVQWITTAKREVTRQRRIEKTAAMLREGRRAI